MDVVWGVVLILVGGLAWLGQMICAFSPRLGVKWGLAEAPAEIERALYVEARGEAIWDAFILWVLPLSGVLLLIGHPYWPLAGLVIIFIASGEIGR